MGDNSPKEAAASSAPQWFRPLLLNRVVNRVRALLFCHYFLPTASALNFWAH